MIFRLGILRNETDDDHFLWISACERFSERLVWKVIDLTRNTWLEDIQAFQPDILLTKPGGLTSVFKQLYDERLMILVEELGYRCFPSLEEVLVYENKRYLSYWLKAHHIPHPRTDVFYYQNEALDFIEKTTFPLVAKTNIGASGSGIVILKNIRAARDYIVKVFSGKGAPVRTGPNLQRGGLWKRGFHYILHPSDIIPKLRKYLARAADVQQHFVIFQEYIPHDFEWRVVRIGESFFAHKKLKIGDKASGSLLKNYDNPPLSVLDFVREITDRHRFFSQAVDIYESNRGYLVNEMQCIFGQSDPYQMLVDGKPGRYLFNNGKWIFEEGDFNRNQSFDLRVEFILNHLLGS